MTVVTLANRTGLNTPQRPYSLSRRLVVVGDSITAQGYYAVGGGYKYSNHGWWCHALAQLGWPLKVANVAALSGRTVADTLATFDAEVVPYNPSEIWALLGQNDVGNVAVATTISRIDQFIARCNALGARVVLGTVTPRTTMTTQIGNDIADINRAIYERARAGTILAFDAHGALRDTTSATGQSLSALQIDGVHPNALGAYRIGTAAAYALSSVYPRMDAYASSNTDNRTASATSAQLLTNPMLTGAAGTVGTGGSGTCATSWSLNRSSGSALTVAGAKTSDTVPRQREWQKMTFGGSPSGTEIIRFQQSLTVASFAGALTLGTSAVRGRATFKTASLPATIQYVRLYIECIDSVPAVTNNTQGLADSSYTQGELPTAEFSIETPEMVVPVGTVMLRVTVNVAFAAGAASGDVYVCDPSVVVVA